MKRVTGLGNNALTSLPPELGALAELEELLLHGNQLLGIPAHALRGLAKSRRALALTVTL